MPDRETALQSLLDEAAIRNATARFADSVTRVDIDSFQALWAEDAEWTIGEPVSQHAQGIQDIVAMLRHLWTGNDYFVQFAVQGPIEIDGDEATARCLVHESARGPNDRYYRNNGMWHDRLRRSGDRWVFTSRTYEYLWLDFSPFTGDTFAVARV